MDKSPDAFRTISEVATELDLPQHVLRFWETRFSQIKPMKRGGGRRYYRPEDVDLLCGIRHLLYGEGYTIKGVQRILKEQGIRFVMDIWRDAEMAMGELSATPGSDVPSDVPSGATTPRDDAEERGVAEEPGPRPVARHEEPAVADRVTLDRRVAAAAPTAHDLPDHASLPEQPSMKTPTRPPARAGVEEGAPADFNGKGEESMPRDVLADDTLVDAGPAAARSSFGFMERLRGDTRRDNAPHDAAAQQLAKDDIRRLQATLFELLECKRILDQAR